MRPRRPAAPGITPHGDSPTAELDAAREWVSAALASPSAADRASLAVVLAELDHADGGDGLPQAFTHPDFVLANVVATAAPGMVVVDWTGAGRGPRLWSLAFLLWVEGGKDLRRIDLLAAGYRRRVELEPDEVDRIAGMVRARHLVFVAWNLAAGRIGPAEAAELVRESRERGEAIAERSRWAFTAAPQTLTAARAARAERPRSTGTVTFGASRMSGAGVTISGVERHLAQHHPPA